MKGKGQEVEDRAMKVIKDQYENLGSMSLHETQVLKSNDSNLVLYPGSCPLHHPHRSLVLQDSNLHAGLGRCLQGEEQTPPQTLLST